MNSDPSILLADDNPDDVFIFQKVLKSAAVSIPLNVVTDGQEAVDYLSTIAPSIESGQRPPPLLMFLDLKMPYLDGFEVLSWIRQQPVLQSLPVVVLSGSDQPKDQQRAEQLGAYSYLVKPPKAHEIRQLVQSIQTKVG